MDKTIESEGRKYLKYGLTADMLCIGERMRASSYRRCLEVFPCTTLEGAFKARFPHPDRIVYAAAKFIRKPKKELLVYSPRDRVMNSSKVPLQIEYLTNVNAEVYVLKNDWTRQFPREFEMQIGAMRPQGFGRCQLRFIQEVEGSSPRLGVLAVRMQLNEGIKDAFAVRQVIEKRLGYLFVPEHGNKGHYELALFEDSRVAADPVVLTEVWE